jgi:hypothetical protein
MSPAGAYRSSRPSGYLETEHVKESEAYCSPVHMAPPASPPRAMKPRQLQLTKTPRVRMDTHAFLCSLAHGRFCNLGSEDAFVSPKSLRWGALAGKGAYAHVFLCDSAHAVGSTSKCAVKQLQPAVALDKVELKFFLLEAHIISQLQHRCT